MRRGRSYDRDGSRSPEPKSRKRSVSPEDASPKGRSPRKDEYSNGSPRGKSVSPEREERGERERESPARRRRQSQSLSPKEDRSPIPKDDPSPVGDEDRRSPRGSESP